MFFSFLRFVYTSKHYKSSYKCLKRRFPLKNCKKRGAQKRFRAPFLPDYQNLRAPTSYFLLKCRRRPWIIKSTLWGSFQAQKYSSVYFLQDFLVRKLVFLPKMSFLKLLDSLFDNFERSNVLLKHLYELLNCF